MCCETSSPTTDQSGFIAMTAARRTSESSWTNYSVVSPSSPRSFGSGNTRVTTVRRLGELTTTCTSSHHSELVGRTFETAFRVRSARHVEQSGSRSSWRVVYPLASRTGGHGTPGQHYTIETPSGKRVTPPRGSCWRVTRERFNEMVESGEIWFGPSGNNVPRKKVYRDNAKGLVPSTWWPHSEVGHTQEARKEVRLLFPEVEPFLTPKPERLMADFSRSPPTPAISSLTVSSARVTVAVAPEVGPAMDRSRASSRCH